MNRLIVKAIIAVALLIMGCSGSDIITPSPDAPSVLAHGRAWDGSEGCPAVGACVWAKCETCGKPLGEAVYTDNTGTYEIKCARPGEHTGHVMVIYANYGTRQGYYWTESMPTPPFTANIIIEE